jgi:hypothetical protein
MSVSRPVSASLVSLSVLSASVCVCVCAGAGASRSPVVPVFVFAPVSVFAPFSVFTPVFVFAPVSVLLLCLLPLLAQRLSLGALSMAKGNR